MEGIETGLLEAVANVGFPIAVAAYLLWRMEGKIDALNKAIYELTLSLDAFKKVAK